MTIITSTGFLFRDKLYCTDVRSRMYALAIIGSVTEKDSEFGKATIDIRTLPDEEMLKGLEKMNYDLLIGKIGETPMSHMAFQEHRRATIEWEMFSAYVAKQFRGQGASIDLATELINRGRELSVDKIRFGKGKREEMYRIINRLENDKSLGITADASTGWVYLN